MYVKKFYRRINFILFLSNKRCSSSYNIARHSIMWNRKRAALNSNSCALQKCESRAATIGGAERGRRWRRSWAAASIRRRESASIRAFSASEKSAGHRISCWASSWRICSMSHLAPPVRRKKRTLSRIRAKFGLNCEYSFVVLYWPQASHLQSTVINYSHNVKEIARLWL